MCLSLLDEHVRQLVTLLLGSQVGAQSLLEEFQGSLITRNTQQLHRSLLVWRKPADLLDERSDKFGVWCLFLF